MASSKNFYHVLAGLEEEKEAEEKTVGETSGVETNDDKIVQIIDDGTDSGERVYQWETTAFRMDRK